MAALEGADWNSGKGKGKTGKGKKGGKAKEWSNYGRASGKSIGKSFDYWGNDDYYDAGGWEEPQEHNHYDYYGNYIGNVTMMLERGGETE